MSTFRKSLKILPLIILFLAGQLQAQPVFSCSMVMDMSDSEISQYGHKSCQDLGYDDSSRLNVPISDLVLELDIDPSEEKLTTYNQFTKSLATKPLSGFSFINYSQSRSKILLITQRLRF